MVPGAHGDERSDELEKKTAGMERILTLDGQFVHNAGNLQMNITNWGIFGSLPKSDFVMSEAPSAQWPASSAVEYLYAAGLWVGARVGGIPQVSTCYPETEFYPPREDVHTIYETFDGDINGAHFPDDPDDDMDGFYDEDWLNGIDDDGDGLVDEDFAAFGTQMFSCGYSDFEKRTQIVWPEHTPMYIAVRQETYQWAEEGHDDYIAVRYYIENVGNRFLDDVYLGIYADFDAGPRNYGVYHMDDMIGVFEGTRCASFGDDKVPIKLKIVYVYDDDGDGGRTPGYFGLSLIDYPMYAYWAGKKHNPAKIPTRMWVRFNAIRIYSSLLPFGWGGEPTNDFERYDALSTWGMDEKPVFAGDYKVLVSMGPFELPPGSRPFELNLAYVCGDGLEDMLQNAANATARFRGCWVDLDRNAETGTEGRETPVEGPIDRWFPDPCTYPEWEIEIPAGETCWTNLDCSRELWELQYTGCGHPPSSKLKHFQTGLDGKEHQVFWVSGVAPPPPNMRVVPGDHMVTVYWDNLSEVVRDPYSLQDDFEGYQVWRAENWHRPVGTGMVSGPQTGLWRLLEAKDVVNGVGDDFEFRIPYEEGGWQYTPVADITNREEYIRMFRESLKYAPIDSVPCPPGLEDLQCDSLETLVRWDMGLDGGKQYYKYIDRKVKNGLPYFYAVTTYDHNLVENRPFSLGRFSTPTSNFCYTEPCSRTQEASDFQPDDIYVVPNPVTIESMEPWRLGPTNDDPSGLKCEFRNLPGCRCTVRIYTLSGDLVQTLHYEGKDENGTLKWDLLTRNGQDVTSGVYLYSIEPMRKEFPRVVKKFVVIR